MPAFIECLRRNTPGDPFLARARLYKTDGTAKVMRRLWGEDSLTLKKAFEGDLASVSIEVSTPNHAGLRRALKPYYHALYRGKCEKDKGRKPKSYDVFISEDCLEHSSDAPETIFVGDKPFDKTRFKTDVGLFFGVIDNDAYFVIHPPDWAPFQKRFRAPLKAHGVGCWAKTQEKLFAGLNKAAQSLAGMLFGALAEMIYRQTNPEDTDGLPKNVLSIVVLIGGFLGSSTADSNIGNYLRSVESQESQAEKIADTGKSKVIPAAAEEDT